MANTSALNLCACESDTRPIGIFDSGVGGLSVWIEIRRHLPFESTVYYADQAHVPYGQKSISQVREFSFGITKFLLNRGVKIIVIACNTASGAALKSLRNAFPDIDFIGMEPAVKPAVEKTHTGHVGVIATATAFQGMLYQQLVHRFGRNVEIHTSICPGLVEAIEAGDIDHPTTLKLLQNCLKPLVNSNIDQLVFGCTHYPFVRPIVQHILGDSVTLIDPAPAVARQTGRILASKTLLCTSNQASRHVVYTSGTEEQLQKTVEKLVGYQGAVIGTTWCDNRIVMNE